MFSLATRWQAATPNQRGAAWLLCSALSFAVMNALVRWMGADIHGFQQAFFRCLFGWVALFPFVWAQAPAVFRTSRPVMHLLRGLIGVCAMLNVFYALSVLPLAESTAIFFARPLFIIPLSVLFLGEAVDWRRGLATAVGFIGVLVMLQPGHAAIGAGELAALAATGLMATVLVLVKKMTATESPITMLFYFSGIGTIGTLLPALTVWVWPTPAQWLMLGVMGSIGSLAQWLAVRAYRVGDAGAITPMDYSQMVFAVLFGYLLFAQLPGWHTVAGAAIVIAATLYILRRK